MNIKESELKQIIKQVVRESIQNHEYSSFLNNCLPANKKSKHLLAQIKESLQTQHPDWDDVKIDGAATAKALQGRKAWKDIGDEEHIEKMVSHYYNNEHITDPNILTKKVTLAFEQEIGRADSTTLNTIEAEVQKVCGGSNPELTTESKIRGLVRLVKSKGVRNPNKIQYLVNELYHHSTNKYPSVVAVLNEIHDDMHDEGGQDGLPTHISADKAAQMLGFKDALTWLNYLNDHSESNPCCSKCVQDDIEPKGTCRHGCESIHTAMNWNRQ